MNNAIKSFLITLAFFAVALAFFAVAMALVIGLIHCPRAVGWGFLFCLCWSAVWAGLSNR